MVRPRLSSLLLIGALLVAVLAAANFYVGKNAAEASLAWHKDQLEKVKAAKQVLEKEKEELTKAKEALEAKLNDSDSKVKSLETQARDLSNSLAQEKRAREALNSEVAKARNETGEWKSRLDSEQQEKKVLTEELAKAKQSYVSLSNELTTLRQAKEALEKRVKEMLSSQASEAEKIVVKPGPGLAGRPLEGKVLVVNREFNFIVVNLGSRDGVKEGSTFAVWQKEKKIGTAQVERIYDNMSAATVLAEEQKGQIKEGDLVRVAS